MQTLEIFDPSGATEISRLHAPRLPSLKGRTIAMLSDDMWQSHRMLPMLKEMLEARYDDIAVIPETEFPMGNTAMDTDAAADMMVARGVDGVIVGNAS
jgi:pyridoxal biosynthesis lyase PdxS